MRSQRTGQLLFGHPLVKALALGLFGILGNVLAGTFVFDITRQGSSGPFIEWSNSLHSRSFWLLLSVIMVMGLYGWGMTRFETRARKALTEADVLGIALGQLLGPMIEVAKKDVEAGKIRSLDDVKRIFGSGGGQP